MAYAAPVWRNLRRDIPSLRAVASHSSRATFMIAFCSGVGSGGMNSSFDTGRTSIGKRSLSDSSIRSRKRFGISPSLRSRFGLPTRSSSRARLPDVRRRRWHRSEEHTSELQSQSNLVCRLLLEKKKKQPAEAQSINHIAELIA